MSLATCSQPYKSALEIQDMLLKDMRDDETTPAVRAQQARAWKEIESLKRVMRGLPANTSQSIRADTPKKTRRQSQQVTAPIESEQDEPRTRASAPVHPTEQLPDNVTDARGTAKTE